MSASSRYRAHKIDALKRSRVHAQLAAETLYNHISHDLTHVALKNLKLAIETLSYALEEIENEAPPFDVD